MIMEGVKEKFLTQPRETAVLPEYMSEAQFCRA